MIQYGVAALIAVLTLIGFFSSPQQPEMAATMLQLGDKAYQVAKPWAAVEAGGALQAAVHARTLFFHHSTRTTVHEAIRGRREVGVVWVSRRAAVSMVWVRAKVASSQPSQ